MPRKGKRSQAQKLRWEKLRAEPPTQQMVSEEPPKPSSGTGFCHRPQRWPKSLLTGHSYKLVIPPESPGKKFVLIIGDTQLRAIVDGFIQMPEGHLSFGIMTAPKASTSELQTEVVHAVLPRTPEAVCLLAPSNALTSSKTIDETAVDFAELLSSICSRWPKVFVVDFPPCLNIETSYQDLVRQEFRRVAAGMGVKYFSVAEYFPLTWLELWGRDGVRLSDCEGMRILVRLLWSASVQQLETQPPVAKVPPTPSPPSRTLSPMFVRDGVPYSPSPDPFQCKPVGQGRKTSQPGEPSKSQGSAQIRITQQQVPREEECFSPLNPVWFSSTALRAMEEASPPHKSGLADFKPSPKRKKTSQPGEPFQSQSSFQARMVWQQVPQEEECFSPLNPVWFSSTALRAMEEASSSHMSGLVDFEPPPKRKKTVSSALAKQPLTKARHPPRARSPVNNKVKSHQMADVIENQNKEDGSDSFCRNRCMMVHKARPSTVAERKSPSSEERNVTEEKLSLPKMESIKEELIDEDYHQTLKPSIPAECIKNEPNLAKKDLKIGSVFSLTEDSPSAAPTVTFMDLPASCSKVMTQSQQGLQAQVDTDRTMKDFCSQTCVSSFHDMKIKATKIPIMPLTPHSQCSVCRRSCISKHEIVRQDVVHKICSDPCVLHFCKMNNLTLCANCHSCCNTLLILKMEEGDQKLCSAECLAQFKKKIQTPQPCAMCQTSSLISDMVEHRKSEDVVQLFCSSSCVMASKIQAVSAAGIPLNCDNCGNNTIPACHLAMSDASIKNFCSLTCAMTFKENQKDTPAASDDTRTNNQTQCDFFKPPGKMPCVQSQHLIKTTPKMVRQKETQEDTPAASNETRANIQTQCDFFKPSGKLLCAQCRRIMKTTPKVVQQKNKMDFVCSLACFQEFKRANKILGKCEFCKSEQIIRKAKRVDGKDCYFCSERCKKLFYHQLVRQWGKHCSSCAYCQSCSRTLVTAKYEGNNEEFCSEECSTKFKTLVCHVAQCDTCGRKGKLKQSLPMLGEVKHFCNLKCLRHFCNNEVQTINTALVPNRPGSGYHPCWRNLESSPPRPSGVAESSPVIANVVSLASSLARKTSTSSSTTHCGLIPDIQTKVFGHASTQTLPKEMKNKSMICAPFVHNKGVSCTTQTVDTETQTDNFVPKVIVVPLPVPVYVPLPMNMYSQYTQKSLGLPLPVPVPVVLPPVMSDLPEPTVKAMEKEIQLEPSEGKPNHRSEMEIKQDDRKWREEGQEAGESTEGDGNKIQDMKDQPFSKDLGSLSSLQESANPPLSTPSPPPAPEMTEDPQSSPSPQSPEPAPPLSPQTLDKVHNKNTLSPAAQEDMDQIDFSKVLSRKHHRLKSECGIEAWKRWIQWRDSQTNLDPVSSHAVRLKEDVLHYSAAELCDALCHFVNEVKRPDGEPYSPDNLFYLCLSLQQYLFDNSRLENIFSDLIYNKFSTEFTKILKLPVTARAGHIRSRVEEEFLWDCKQLGAYSPIVLLNTLLFFGCKYFGFTTVEQHRQLSFAHVIWGTKTNPNSTKTTFLRFCPPTSINDADADTDGVPAKRCKKTQTKESFLEMTEDRENPLRCPVRLYKFYLSKCSDLVRQRSDLFYLCPDHHCVTSSPLWFSFTPLDDSTLQDMLVRILTVRELQEDDTR